MLRNFSQAQRASPDDPKKATSVRGTRDVAGHRMPAHGVPIAERRRIGVVYIWHSKHQCKEQSRQSNVMATYVICA